MDKVSDVKTLCIFTLSPPVRHGKGVYPTADTFGGGTAGGEVASNFGPMCDDEDDGVRVGNGTHLEVLKIAPTTRTNWEARTNPKELANFTSSQSQIKDQRHSASHN